MVQTLGLLPGLFTAGAIVALCPQVSLAEIFDGNWVTSWLTLSTMLHIQITVLISFLFYLLIISLNKTSALSWREQIQKLFWVFLNQFSSVKSLSCVQLFVTPWTTACQASLSITNSWSSLKLMSIESVMPFSHLILCRPLLLLPPIPPSIRVFSNESTLQIRWSKYWSFSFSIIPSKEHPGLISFRMNWLDLLSVQGTLKSLLQHHSSKASILF